MSEAKPEEEQAVQTESSQSADEQQGGTVIDTPATDEPPPAPQAQPEDVPSQISQFAADSGVMLQETYGVIAGMTSQLGKSKTYLIIFTTIAIGLATLLAAHHFTGFDLSIWVLVPVWLLAIFFALAAIGTAGNFAENKSRLEAAQSHATTLENFLGTKEEDDYFSRLVTINVTNLKEYYLLVKVHTNKSFIGALLAGFVGLCFITYGLFVGTTGQGNVDIAYISAGSGVFIEFISGIFFYLYNKTVRQLKEYHDSLIDVQNVLLSFKLVDKVTDDDKQADMLAKMIEFLATARSRPASAADD